MDDGKVEEDAKNEDIVREGVDDAAQEAHAPHILRDPGQPSAREEELHRCIRIPFLSWNRECVLGRGRDRQHRRIDDEDRISRVSMDYMFLTEYGIAKSIDEAEDLIKKGGGLQRPCTTVIFLKHIRSKSVWAYPIEGKGVGPAEWLITQVLGDLDTCGLDACRIVLKADQEPSILEVQNRIAELNDKFTRTGRL